ncbi:MAG: PglZ domain-containing protein [Pseudomonadota bacterium]
MEIIKYIQNHVFLPRIQKNCVLVVYDPEKMYQDVCLTIPEEPANNSIKVIDAGNSSITSREDALKALKELGSPSSGLKGLLVYVPAKAPETEESKQKDPFSLYTVCGSVFPDGAGDAYMHICLKAKPDHATEIRRIFSQDPQPSFAVIDAIGGGKGWPNLQVALSVESANDILFALLAPTENQKQALEAKEGWVSEAKELLAMCLSLKLITRGKTWSSISDELWRFVLYSEFVFDLPGDLPDSISNVPHANVEAKPIIEDLCDRLRNDKRTQATYIQRAQLIETDLHLPDHCKSISNLGVRDTFPFEERSFLTQGMTAIKNNDADTARFILKKHTDNVWAGIGESQAQWGLMGSAVSLCEACDDYERQLPDYSRDVDSLIDFYVSSLREIDRLQREFEQAVSDMMTPVSMMNEIVEKARGKYRNLSSKVQDLFTRHLEKSGWPPIGRLSNADLFESKIAPRLQESGHKVAFFMVDSLRYELGVALEQQLTEDDAVELIPAVAQLPSITSVGMASLLPGAGKNLSLTKEDNKIVPFLGDIKVTTVKQRMDVLRSRYGQRFEEIKLADFVKRRKKFPVEVDLLVIRSVEIDTYLENDPETTLRLIQDILKRIRVAIHKLKGMGFHEVVIATDHGFFLHPHAEAGDVCAKPNGNWVFVHDRLALGTGLADTANFVYPANHLGIRGDFNNAAGPRSLVAYRAGELYFHGGLSLQECIVPVILIRLSKEQPQQEKAKIKLSYKNEAKHITTRLPVIDVEYEKQQLELFAQENEIELLLEAHDKNGKVVGEAKAGGVVNPATGTITIKQGERLQVTLKMQLEFEGKFTIQAMNPSTLANFSKLELKTDYVV